jgi:NADH-quinone oxidoreductase subunit L
MHGDDAYARYFGSISLFVFSMTLLVLARDFLLLYAAWEAVGLCSYLLIGHYRRRPSAGAAARKAFLVNRIGDFGFLLGIFWLWLLVRKVAPTEANLLDFATVFQHVGKVAALDPEGLTYACLLLFAGAVGKSAQFPLHVWLPDAMEGPSPVSALIHAATMVTAGVYLVARLTPVLTFAPTAQLVISSIGAFTALLAALIALTQYDLKRVLAYSTVSQLGFMFAALGCSSGMSDRAFATAAVIAAMFHLFTHAFFKALLFLSAGSVMHAMGDVIDMRRFGGLRRTLPFTHLCFLCGAVALAGIPIFAGFWSKDAILDVVSHAAKEGPRPTAFAVIRLALMLTSFLTAFYTFRAYFLTFWGEEKFPEEAGHHPHEAGPAMLGPMLLLSVAALFVGFVFGPGLSVGFKDAIPKQTVIESHVFAHYLEHATGMSSGGKHDSPLSLMLISGAIAIAGAALAHLFYVRRPELPERTEQALEPLAVGSQNKFYFDEIYAAVLVRPLEALSPWLPKFDRHWIDKLVDAIGAAPLLIGAALRPWQRGFVHGYAWWMLLGTALLVVIAASSLG